jgi:hypothetical protein
MNNIAIRLSRRSIGWVLTVLLAFLVPIVRSAFERPDKGAAVDIIIGTIGVVGFSLWNLVDFLVFEHPKLPSWARFWMTFTAAGSVCFMVVGLMAASVSLLAPDYAITSTLWIVICGIILLISLTIEIVIALKQ